MCNIPNSLDYLDVESGKYSTSKTQELYADNLGICYAIGVIFPEDAVGLAHFNPQLKIEVFIKESEFQNALKIFVFGRKTTHVSSVTIDDFCKKLRLKYSSICIMKLESGKTDMDVGKFSIRPGKNGEAVISAHHNGNCSHASDFDKYM